LQLADTAARRGNPDTARELFAEALALAEADGTGLETAVVSAAIARFEITAGNVERARSRQENAERSVALLGTAHPARHHWSAGVAASALMIAVEDGDLPLARERAATAYEEATASKDMPLVAMVGGSLASLAHALGHSERAAEMLGACAVVRGGEDATDLTATMLSPRLRDALGPEGYARAYERGKTISRAEALTLLDPATL
jgi:hypothetical protein